MTPLNAGVKRILNVLAVILALGIFNCAARGEEVLYSFAGQGDASHPLVGLIADSAGNLYGTTEFNSSSKAGAVFELFPPTKQGGSWTESVLYTFQGGSDGSWPMASLVMDKKGNLYGTTSYGGANNAGTIFQLTPPAQKGGKWTESTLFSFNGTTNGQNPWGLTFGPTGGLFGVTQGGGNGCGTAFELIHKANGTWAQSVIYSFQAGNNDGCVPDMRGGNLAIDKSGDFYGTTSEGGQFNHGTIFELIPPLQKGGSWTESVLYNFNDAEDGDPGYGGLIFDSVGNLYGTTESGGQHGGGTVFELSPAQGGGWKKTVLHSFGAKGDGTAPSAGLVFDAAGNLYSTTVSGGQYGQGIVFQLTPGQSAWSETILHSFGQSNDGTASYAPLIDKLGVLYGTTFDGGKGPCGSSGCGTVFSIQP
jgi:uncharacterized repeat protein (TIGR03803 family)